jgi:hypothetical protein
MTLTIKIQPLVWGDDFKATTEVIEETSFRVNFDPLAFVLEGRDSIDFVNNRKYKNKTMYEQLSTVSDTLTVTNVKYTTESKIIRRHFRNKILIATLQSHQISPFRTKLDEILSDSSLLKIHHIPVLLRLPDFYQEDKEMENIFENYSNIPLDEYDPIVVSFDGNVQFVKKFTRYGRYTDVTKYFFKNENNQVFCFKIDVSNHYSNLMDYFAKTDKVFGLRGKFARHAETGYSGFNFYHNTGKEYEFY